MLADGSTRPVQDLHVGDEIYGTVKHDEIRRYQKTSVLAHWAVRKAAYRLTLEDGTELIASGDHRFLSNRGWKYVVGAEQGSLRRPHLTTSNRLVGVGSFAPIVHHDEEYQRGYLCGIIRGDANLGSYPDRRPWRHSRHYRFRLAMVDHEALDRAEQYLRACGIHTDRFLFQEATLTTRPLQAIRTSTRDGFEAIQRMIVWPDSPARSWSAGFLAGVFDAEGGYGAGILRIKNTDAALIDWIVKSLARFGLPWVRELSAVDRAKPMYGIRIPGGMRTHLRFFHTVDPAISRKRGIAGRAVKHEANPKVISIEPVGERELVDITTGTGDFIANGIVSHNCFARVTHWYLDQDGVNDWSSRIFVKKNAPEVLRRELAKPTWTREQVHIGTATDPYQPAEGAYRITRQILEALRDFKTPAALVTKSTMIVRDRDVLAQLARGPGAFVFFSITTVDPALAKEIEPDVPPPQRRLEAMRALAEAGIRVGVLLAPVLPGITDDEAHLAAVVTAAKEYGASALSTNTLYLGDVTRQAFFGYLEQKRPALVPEYEQLYQGKYAPRATQQRIEAVVAALKARAGFTNPPRRPSPPETPRPAQLRLL